MLPDTFTTAEIEERFGPLPKPVLDVREIGAAYLTLFPRGDGYISHGPRPGEGEIMILNTMPDCELFTKEGIGAFNITGLRRYIAANKRTLKVEKVALTRNMTDALADAGFDPVVIETMTIQRRNDPVIFFGEEDGVHLLDGIHRIKRRAQDGCDFVRAYRFDAETLAPFRMAVYENHDGVWSRVDRTDAILPELMRAPPPIKRGWAA